MKYKVDQNGLLSDKYNDIPIAELFSPTQHDNTYLNDDVRNTLEKLTHNSFTDTYNATSNVVEDLCFEFSKNEIPIGLIKPLVSTMSEFDTIDFIIDDSGSMSGTTTGYDSRWLEVKARILQIIDIIVYLPIKQIYIGFMNMKESNTFLNRNEMTPLQYKKHIHDFIEKVFKRSPGGGTPTAETLKGHFKLFKRALHYLFTDGAPSDGVNNVIQIVKSRDASNNPITFVSCTDTDHETEWMKELDNIVPNVAEVDDYKSESTEVFKNQGTQFPYTKGLWLMCLIAGSTVKFLDDIDEKVIFKKKDMELLTGRNLTDSEYNKYLHQHPSYKSTASKSVFSMFKKLF